MPSLIFRRERKHGVSYTVRYPGAKARTFPLLRLAKDHLKTLQDAEAAGKPVNESEQPLSKFMLEYLDATDLRTTTRASYKETFEAYIEPTLGKTALKDITPTMVQRMYTELRKTLSPRSVRYCHSILRTAMAHGVALKLLRSNPCEKLKLPKMVEVEIFYLRGPEIPAFLDAARSSMHGVLFEFMLASGVRPGEARGLRWSDIDFAGKTVRIERTVSDAKPYVFNEPKTSKGKRTLELPDKTMDMLMAHRAAQRLDDDAEPLDLVFGNVMGTPLDRRNLSQRYLKPLLRLVASSLYPGKGSDFERVCACNLYSLRHSHATKLIEAGVDLRTVSDRLGHKDVTTTIETYVHSTPTMKKAAVEEISKAMYL